MSSYMFAESRFLWLLLLTPLPFLFSLLQQSRFPSLDAAPMDMASRILGVLLKVLAMLVIVTGAIALAQPYRLEQTVQKLATGAHVVIVLDRSLSMDFTMSDDSPQGAQKTKTQIAGELLQEFVDKSPHDQFGVAAFTSSPIFVLPISEHRDAVKAAISALMRPGIEGTNVGLGLELGVRMFALDPQAKSPAVLLVSDGEYGGAGFFTVKLQSVLRSLFQKAHAHLYWLFLRSQKGNEDIFKPPPAGEEDTPHTKPERHMDLFFKSIGVPYRVFWADNPKAIQDAVDDIDRLETRPIRYSERIPRKDLASYFYAAAFAMSLLLVLAKLAETDLRGSTSIAKGAP